MFCPQCGKQLVPESNFCNLCGAAVHTPGANATRENVTPPPPAPSVRILRPRYPRAIAGVCAGFALHFGWDLTLVRILTVLFTCLTSGVGVLVYLGAWILMPDAPYALTSTQNQQGTTA